MTCSFRENKGVVFHLVLAQASENKQSLEYDSNRGIAYGIGKSKQIFWNV